MQTSDCPASSLIPHDQAMTLMQQMDRAIDSHQQWLKRLNRILICGEAVPSDEIAHDAHCQCTFGNWYHNLPKELLEREESILALGEPHRLMHAAARHLLLLHESKSDITSAAYEAFMDQAVEFKQQLRGYQLELMQRVCSVDHLTGIWNRNFMTSHLEAEAERARRGHKDFSICLLDLDKFKCINDQFGHPVGDQVLHSVAQFLKDNLRAYDTMFRYGGEEFLICLPSTDLNQAVTLLNRLREKLAAIQVCEPPYSELRVTASFGVTSMASECEISQAIERADHALLCAKAKGRNTVCAWDLSDNLVQPSDQPAA